MTSNPLEIRNPKQLPLAAYLSFFFGESFVYKGSLLKTRKITTRGGTTLHKLVVGEYTYLEQNPASSSQYGAMARKGSKILWIIHTKTQKYIGRVVNGEVTKL